MPQWKSYECFDCGECYDDIDQRRQRRCALPGFDEAMWRPVADGMSEPVYFGRPKIVGVEALARYRKRWGPAADPSTPYESPEGGCPGAWYRCAFAQSVTHYERTIMKDGIAESLPLTRSDDRLVLEAALYLESQRLRHRNHWNEVIDNG